MKVSGWRKQWFIIGKNGRMRPVKKFALQQKWFPSASRTTDFNAHQAVIAARKHGWTGMVCILVQ